MQDQILVGIENTHLILCDRRIHVPKINEEVYYIGITTILPHL